MQRCSRLTAANIPAPVSVLPAATGSLLELSAQAYPDNEAVVSVQQGIRLTYRELLRQADEMARGLLALGVQVGAALLQGGCRFKGTWGRCAVPFIELPSAWHRPAFLTEAGPRGDLGPQLRRVGNPAVCGRPGGLTATSQMPACLLGAHRALNAGRPTAASTADWGGACQHQSFP